jgi:hypothetical protein|tara:strand:+ start:104 stop:391 length:288 start_codon:yes stop_codon:yes gene_type:complete
MREIITTSLRFQQKMFQAAVSMTTLMMETQMHLFRQQFAFLDNMRTDSRWNDPPTFSVNPKARKKRNRKIRSPCCGPDLQDHYGKRAQDVDVEHI